MTQRRPRASEIDQYDREEGEIRRTPGGHAYPRRPARAALDRVEEGRLRAKPAPEPSRVSTDGRVTIGAEDFGPGDRVSLELGRRDDPAEGRVHHVHPDGSLCVLVLFPEAAADWGWKGCRGMLRIPNRSVFHDDAGRPIVCTYDIRHRR
jgi:hypothetical protein